MRPSNTPGDVLARIRREGRCTSRELVRATGMSRSTVAARLELLIDRGMLSSLGDEPSTGGRKPATFAFNEDHGVVLTADVGATHSRLAVCDLAGTPIVEHAAHRPVARGPKPFVTWMTQRWRALLDDCGRREDTILGIGVGLPAPVAFRSGSPYRPPIMPGWNEFPLAEVLGQTFGVPVLVDNEVNLMALGEYWTNYRSESHLLFVKIATGIGAGIVSEGRIYRGADGAAGDIGHLAVEGHAGVLCSCGYSGCLEAIASGSAIAGKLRQADVKADDAGDVVRWVERGHPQALREVRAAARVIGDALAGVVNVLNPSVLVIGGDLAKADEHLLPGIRAAISSRSLPLATRTLRVERSRLGDRAGVIGAAVTTIEHVLSPEAIDERLGAVRRADAVALGADA